MGYSQCGDTGLPGAALLHEDPVYAPATDGQRPPWYIQAQGARHRATLVGLPLMPALGSGSVALFSGAHAAPCAALPLGLAGMGLGPCARDSGAEKDRRCGRRRLMQLASAAVAATP